MRNLEILSCFTSRLDHIESSDTVATMCLDEYGHLLFVYTVGHHLYVYKYN